MFKNLIIFNIFLIIVFIKSSNSSAACMGCVELDELTFDKTISRYPCSIVKFDTAFPYGEQHEVYSQFAKEIGPKYDNLLVAAVGIKDYGELDNSILGVRFNIRKITFPELFIFRNDTKLSVAKYDKEADTINIENIKKFIGSNCDLYMGLDGCLREYDALSKKFVHSTEEERKEIIKEAEERLEKLEIKKDQNSANVYIVVMKLIMEKGNNFVKEELSRLKNLIATKISANKKAELELRRNVLTGFKFTPKPRERRKKAEL